MMFYASPFTTGEAGRRPRPLGQACCPAAQGPQTAGKQQNETGPSCDLVLMFITF